MSTTPLVSVIMPTHNRVEWLPASLDSVLRQTGVTFEVVVVNDCSTDGTAAYLDGLHNDQVRVVHHERNLGMARALDSGFAASLGAYVTRLDDDDLLLPGALAEMAAVLDGHADVDVVYTDWQTEWSDSIFGGSQGEIETMRAGDIDDLPRANVIWGFLMRRRAWDGVGGHDPYFGPATDYDFWLRVYQMGWRFEVLHVPLYLYRYHKGGMTYQLRPIHVKLAEEAQDNFWRRRMGFGLLPERIARGRRQRER